MQHETIPHAITGVDILCQAKSGMGKTAVFVLSILQQLNVDSAAAAGAGAATKRAGGGDAAEGTSATAATSAADSSAVPGVMCLGLAHTRELAFQIKNEFERFSKYLKHVKCEVVYGGVPIQKNIELLADPKRVPSILIGTPGRVLALLKGKHLDPSKIAHFVLDECDKCLEKLDMRKDVQSIFVSTPKKKSADDLPSVLCSADLNWETREQILSFCPGFLRCMLRAFATRIKPIRASRSAGLLHGQLLLELQQQLVLHLVVMMLLLLRLTDKSCSSRPRWGGRCGQFASALCKTRWRSSSTTRAS